MASPWWVDDDTQGLAYNVVDEMLNVIEEINSIRVRRGRGAYPTFLSPGAREVAKRYEEERLAELERELYELESMFLSHPVGMLAVAQRLPRCFAAAFVAAPPQVTTKRGGLRIKPGAWINHCFLVTKLRVGGVERKHAPKIAKLCSKAVHGWISKYRVYRRVLPDALLAFVERKRRQYEPSKGRRAAEVLALKDAVRVLIGNAWLVWIWIALDLGLITEQDVVLPYNVAGNPLEAETMIDPAYTFTAVPQDAPEELKNAVREATWRKLVKRVAENA